MKTIGKMWVLDKHDKDFLCDVLTRLRLENKSGCQLTNEELENASTIFLHWAILMPNANEWETNLKPHMFQVAFTSLIWLR